MSNHNSNGTTRARYMERVTQIAPGAKRVKEIQVARTKRHGIEDARKAVSEKLTENLAYLRDPENCKRPDLVFKTNDEVTYVMGIKYGNRWLNGVFDGANYLQGLNADQLAELLKAFASDALAGDFDQFIEPIMKANIDAKAKS